MLDDSHLQRLLEIAKEGDSEALGELLNAYRPTLKQMIEGEIGPNLAARIDASDIVQQTCLSAVRRFSDFEGAQVAQFFAWLRRVHQNNLQDTIRQNKKIGKRAVSREQPLGDAGWLATPMAGPSGETPSQNAMRREASAAVPQLMAALPEDQRTAVELRYFEGWQLKDIARHLERSEDAVAGLLRRGLRNLRQNYGDAQAEL